MSTLADALRRRKFVPQTKEINELIKEQKQLNYGPVINARLPVSIVGGDGNGQSYIISSFDDIQLDGHLRNNLCTISYFEPTDVQKCVIPLIQRTSNDILCLAATGSGKSGSFLIPIINRLHCLRFNKDGSIRTKNANSPLAIIISHTKELVEQLYSLTETLSFETQVGVAYARGALPFPESRKILSNGCDILITTPGRLRQYLEDSWILVDDVQFVVIDEADKFIVDDEFACILDSLYKQMRGQDNHQFRTFMFSATLTEIADCVINNYLKKDFYRIIVGIPNQAVAHVKQKICKVDDKFGYSPRMKMVIQLVKTISTKVKPTNGEHFCYDTQRTLIFVNDARSCDRVAIILCDLGFRAININSHRQMEQRYRAVKAFNEGKYHILVGTDVIARGMNFPKVNNVILYELPPIHRYQEYVHRIGRTGRIGTEGGCAYVFFDPKSRNDELQTEFLIEQLENSNQLVPSFLREMQKSLSDMRSKLTNEFSSACQNSVLSDNLDDDEDDENEEEKYQELIDNFSNSLW